MTRRLTDQMLDATVEAARTRALDETVVLRFGKVTAVNTTTKRLTVDLGGSSVRSVPYMRSYSPAVNDTVWLLHQGSQLVAVGAN